MNKTYLIGLIALLFFLLPTNFVVGQNSMPAASTTSEKERLAVELFGETSELFPASVVEDVISTVRDQAVEQMKTDITSTLKAKVDESKSYSPQKKASIKAALPELSENIGEETRRIFTEGFTVQDWVGTASITNFEKKFTVAELKQLIGTFQSSEGREFVTLFNQTISASLKDKNAKVELNGSPQVIAKFNRFAETSLGKKFFNVLIDDVYAEVSGKMEKWSEESIKRLKKELDSGEIHRLIVEFAEQNLQ